jgi:hypothetical protein
VKLHDILAVVVAASVLRTLSALLGPFCARYRGLFDSPQLRGLNFLRECNSGLLQNPAFDAFMMHP